MHSSRLTLLDFATIFTKSRQYSMLHAKAMGTDDAMPSNSISPRRKYKGTGAGFGLTEELGGKFGVDLI